MTTETKWIVDVLGEVLAPLPADQRGAILEWVKREIATRAIVQYVYEDGPPILRDADGNETGGPQIWKLGEPSPLDENEIVFCMFYWEEERVVAVYSLKQQEIDGQQATFFFRSLVFKPVHVHGPVHHGALVNELGAFLDDAPDTPPDDEEREPESEPEPARAANGGA